MSGEPKSDKPRRREAWRHLRPDPDAPPLKASYTLAELRSYAASLAQRVDRGDIAIGRASTINQLLRTAMLTLQACGDSDSAAESRKAKIQKMSADALRAEIARLTSEDIEARKPPGEAADA